MNIHTSKNHSKRRFFLHQIKSVCIHIIFIDKKQLVITRARNVQCLAVINLSGILFIFDTGKCLSVCIQNTYQGNLLMEKRNFTRVEFSEGASIKHENQLFFGDIKNVSLQGLFIKTSHEVPLHSPLQVTVYFSPNTSIYLNANVVRCEENGIGVQIKGMDVNSFVHLRNAISLQCKDQGLIMRETYKITNCIH
jgi:hypothetical protein